MQNLNKIKHITIVNVHWNNRGDEAALFGFLHGLRNEYKNAKMLLDYYKQCNEVLKKQ
jgi:hypothetical protein